MTVKAARKCLVVDAAYVCVCTLCPVGRYREPYTVTNFTSHIDRIIRIGNGLDGLYGENQRITNVLGIRAEINRFNISNGWKGNGTREIAVYVAGLDGVVTTSTGNNGVAEVHEEDVVTITTNEAIGAKPTPKRVVTVRAI